MVQARQSSPSAQIATLRSSSSGVNTNAASAVESCGSAAQVTTA
jgi:hypothetical protein